MSLASKGKTVTLELVDASSGQVIATTTSTSNGEYVFEGLAPGDYVVQFTPPASSPVSSTTTNTADDQTDGDDNGSQQDTNGDGLTDGLIQSPVITLTPFGEPTNDPGIETFPDDFGDNTVDFGLVQLGAIGSTVFSDDNNNGQLDPGEETLGEKGKTININLLDANGNVVATTTTDANGSYVFDMLLPGDYVVSFTPPVSLPVSSGPTDTNDNQQDDDDNGCLLYTSPSPRDQRGSRMPSSA